MNYYNGNNNISVYKNIKCEIDKEIPIKCEISNNYNFNIGFSVSFYSNNSNLEYSIGDGLKIDETGCLCVDTTNSVEKDNTKPVTSAAVYTEIGNINVLLATI